jgi:hypothetical protein
MNGSAATSLLSGRAKDRLSQLQRALTNELRALNTQQSLVHGALQACDVNTQSAHLRDYLERINALLSATIRLRIFVARHCDADPVSGPNHEFVEQME